MSNQIEVPAVVQDGAVGEYGHPLDIELQPDGSLRIMYPDGPESGTWAFLYPEQTQALYEGLKARFEEEQAHGIQTAPA